MRGLWKNKCLKKEVAHCTFHITPMSSLSCECLTVEHVSSDFRLLEEDAQCAGHMHCGEHKSEHKSEPDLPIGGNQQISVWEDAWKHLKSIQRKTQWWSSDMRAKLTWFSFIAHVFLPVAVKYCIYCSWCPLHYTESHPCSCCLALCFDLIFKRSLRVNFLFPEHGFKPALFQQLGVGRVAYPGILASQPKMRFQGENKRDSIYGSKSLCSGHWYSVLNS